MNVFPLTPPELIIVEDDCDDRDLIAEAFREQGFHNFLMFSSPLELLEFLDNCGRPLPEKMTLLTDYFMPGMNARQLMEKLNDSIDYHHIKVIIMSSSDYHLFGFEIKNSNFIYLQKAISEDGRKEFVQQVVSRMNEG
jgi:CheY-like chemotaxis protein